jgi:hypothetical protein
MEKIEKKIVKKLKNFEKFWKILKKIEKKKMDNFCGKKKKI